MPAPTTLIIGMILERPMCLDCVATKIGLNAAQAQAAIDRIDVVLKLHREPGCCRACGDTKTVLFLDRPSA